MVNVFIAICYLSFFGIFLFSFYVGYLQKKKTKMPHEFEHQNKRQLDRIVAELHEVLNKVNHIEAKLSQTKKEIEKMSQAMDDLTAQVQANHDLEESAVILINGIAAQLAAAGVDQTKLTELGNSLKASAVDLAAAIQANTPAEPTEPNPPTPPTEPPFRP